MPRNGLSALLEGAPWRTIVIEDRGVPVARLESVASPRGGVVEGRAARLERQGVLRPALAAVSKRLLTTAPPAPKRGATLSDAVVAERRDGR